MPDHITTLAQELAELPPSERNERLRAEVESLSLAERFDLIHRLGVYHHPDSYSGPAATLEETAQLRAALPRIIEERGIQTMLDIPCGDFAWMRHVELTADYTGADVVPELVNANQQRYGNEKRRFVVLDATKDRLPKVDLIHCRDLLIHLSIADCRAALKNFAASGSRYPAHQPFRRAHHERRDRLRRLPPDQSHRAAIRLPAAARGDQRAEQPRRGRIPRPLDGALEARGPRMSLAVLFPRKEYDTIAERYASWQMELRLRQTGEVFFYDEDEAARDAVEEIDAEEVLVVLDPTTTVQVRTETLRNERRPISRVIPQPPTPTPENPTPLLRFIPTTARSILHVGSGDGSLGAAIKQRQRCRVVGIATKRAGAKLDDVYVGDYATIIDILDETFDCVVVTGVLEHTIDPWSLLGISAASERPSSRAFPTSPTNNDRRASAKAAFPSPRRSASSPASRSSSCSRSPDGISKRWKLPRISCLS